MAKKSLKAVLVCQDNGRWYCTDALTTDQARGTIAHIIIFQTSDVSEHDIDDILSFVACLNGSAIHGVYDLRGALDYEQLHFYRKAMHRG